MTLLKAWWDALLSLPRTMRKRRQIQAGRTVSPGEILKVLDRDWVRVLIDLRTA
jgi:hypothetical protein